MEREHYDELWRLTQEATQKLEAVAESSGSCRRMFSFWRLPAFHNPTRTDLYTPWRPRAGEVELPFFTVTTWRRDVDQDKLRDPVERLRHPRVLTPTMEECRLEVSAEAVAEVVSALSEISLPVVRPVEGLVGTDGISFRFSFSQGFYALDVSWWGDGPECWRAATTRIGEVVAGLEEMGMESL